MQHVRTRVQPQGATFPVTQPVRFEPVIHLVKGDIVNLIAETPKRYEEFVAFGPSGMLADTPSPAAWLADMVETVARAAADEAAHSRPLMVSAPIAAMMHPDTPSACEAAAARSRILPQEICIEVTDASLSQSKKDVTRSIEALRRKGFRIAIDATQTWCTPLDTGLRLMLDSVRIDAGELWRSSDLMNRVEAAVACGMAVIAEKARYRDGSDLAALGIDLGARPRTDA
ncbi:EAL domain-containing protein [Henriciella aquimarina]|uniref:EAL domain-containing protein n=1 Tax=Henriciella aquimarina TaxID=545261 RepID=UPI001301D96B|nr:EAL domain-containing protein [Henriciella aquimarina]